MPGNVIFSKLMQRYWRLTRALTLGAQAAVIDPQDRILLVRHTYHPGWHFPGGGVEHHETVEAALTRELEEEVGVELTGKPELFAIYANFSVFPNDHIALFLVRSWQQVRVPEPNYEIAEHGLFARDALPADLSAGTARRLQEIFGGMPRAAMW